jgi:hypothetical protein
MRGWLSSADARSAREADSGRARVESHSAEPRVDTYARKTRYERGAVLQVPGFGDVTVEVSEVLPV